MADYLVRQGQDGLERVNPQSDYDRAIEELRQALGIVDAQGAAAAAQRGEVLPAIGQGAAALMAALGIVNPTGKGARAALKTAEKATKNSLTGAAKEANALIDEPLVYEVIDPTGGPSQFFPQSMLKDIKKRYGNYEIRKLPPPPPLPKFPQYAEGYPETGPPAPAIDKKTGKAFLGRQLTAEAEAFKKERARIVKDMEKNGYTPYFDPVMRSNVDPSYYPPNLDTATIVPAKQATIDTHMATIGSDDSRARLQAAYQRGSEMPNTQQWYAMKQLEDEFIKELGPEDGRKAFQDRFATSMAATTGGANPESNFLMAMYGNYLRKHELPYPEKAYEMPFPVGGRYAAGNMEQHQKIFDAGGFQALGAANPKRHDFSQAFTGNPNVVTMDEQMTSGMVPGLNVPNWYGLHQQVAREEAAKAGVLPRDFQDTAWGGFKNLKDKKYTEGQPMIDVVNESIERTHRLTGMPKEEIVRGIINGNIPLYSLGGGLALGLTSGE